MALAFSTGANLSTNKPRLLSRKRLALALCVAAVCVFGFAFLADDSDHFSGEVSRQSFPGWRIVEHGDAEGPGRYFLLAEDQPKQASLVLRSEHWGEVPFGVGKRQSRSWLHFDTTLLSNGRGDAMLLHGEDGVLRRADGRLFNFQLNLPSGVDGQFRLCGSFQGVEAKWIGDRLYTLTMQCCYNGTGPRFGLVYDLKQVVSGEEETIRTPASPILVTQVEHFGEVTITDDSEGEISFGDRLYNADEGYLDFIDEDANPISIELPKSETAWWKTQYRLCHTENDRVVIASSPDDPTAPAMLYELFEVSEYNGRFRKMTLPFATDWVVPRDISHDGQYLLLHAWTSKGRTVLPTGWFLQGRDISYETATFDHVLIDLHAWDIAAIASHQEASLGVSSSNNIANPWGSACFSLDDQQIYLWKSNKVITIDVEKWIRESQPLD